MFFSGPLAHPFALDLGEKYARWVMLGPRQRKDGMRRIKKWGETVLPTGLIRNGEILDSAKLSLFLKNTLKKATIHSGNSVALSLPESKTYLMVSTASGKDSTALEKEIEQHVPLSLNEVIYDWRQLPETEDVTLVAATPKKTADTFAECLERAGFLPLFMEPQSHAIARSLTPNVPWTHPVGIIELVNHHASFIVVVHGAPFMSLSFALGGQNNEHLDNSNDMSRVIIENTSMAMRFFTIRFPRHGNIQTVFITGDIKEPKTLLAKVGEGLAMPVLLGNPMIHLFKNKKSIPDDHAAHFATTIGLALALP